MATQPSPEQLLTWLRSAMHKVPDFKMRGDLTEEDQLWLGRVSSILEASGETVAAASFRSARHAVGMNYFDRSALMQPLYDVLATLELQVPASMQGAFIAPGDTWNGYAALVAVVQAESDTLLIVDPYISADIFLELIPHAAPRKGTRLLTTSQTRLHAPLLASGQKWQATHTAPHRLSYSPKIGQ